MKRRPVRLFLFSLLAGAGLTPMAHADEASLRAEIEKLKTQIALQAEEVAKLEAEANKLEGRSPEIIRTPAILANQGVGQAAGSPIAATPAQGEGGSEIGGYGELTYNNYVHDASRTQADLRRFVVTLSHQFDERLSVNGEIEFEHAVTSASDAGEAEIEQAYLAYRLNDAVNIKAGLFLMPFGLLNRSHEPPNFYGVERNEVETRIIPSTWREGGVGVFGDTSVGLAWDVGVTTGFDTAKFEEPGAPLHGVHQELQLAKAGDLSVYAALNYHGVPGLTAGGAVFHGNSLHDNADFRADPSRPDFSNIKAPITLWDVHARWQANNLDLEAVYARGVFGDAAKIDAVINTYNTANSTDLAIVPKSFSGWLAQAAYTIWESGAMSLTPFARYERYDTQDSLPAGFLADPLNKDSMITAGLSFKPLPSVVLKMDYQWRHDHAFNDRFNLGLGYQF